MAAYYRYVDSFDAAVAHMEGDFRFSSFTRFREIEDEQRQDSLEGQASYQIEGGGFVQVANDTHPTQAIYILSTTTCAIQAGFGEWRIEIVDPEGLQKKIAAALPANARVFFGQVQYAKRYSLHAELTPQQLIERAWFEKPERYRDECEWRYLIVFGPDFKITNPTIQLRLGDCSDVIAGPKWIAEASHHAEPEALKRPHEMHIPDVRSSTMTGVNGMRQEHLFQWMREVSLTGAPPRDVRDLYDVGRNLFLYSWYQYRFSMVAAQVAIAAVEMALRARFKAEAIDIKDRNGNDKSLRPLFSDAVSRGWISDAGFGCWLPKSISDEERDGNKYCEILKDVLPDIRNSFAHGTSTFIDQAGVVPFLGRSAAIIDQLFPSR